ncbi:hypothetical protein A0H81_10878 [Grifola frondosa]|uniref:Uncharacterized protein n=1 Tax=Grifola frondosa TaxID=5627 RepID=A0A1C7LY90_GRIFR|nr:hypothetical protein A0H81_10878 [Grifola frondosa]
MTTLIVVCSSGASGATKSLQGFCCRITECYCSGIENTQPQVSRVPDLLLMTQNRFVRIQLEMLSFRVILQFLRIF